MKNEMILGLLCIFLIKLFPTKKELERIDLNFILDDEMCQMNSYSLFFILIKG